MAAFQSEKTDIFACESRTILESGLSMLGRNVPSLTQKSQARDEYQNRSASASELRKPRTHIYTADKFFTSAREFVQRR